MMEIPASVLITFCVCAAIVLVVQAWVKPAGRCAVIAAAIQELAVAAGAVVAICKAVADAERESQPEEDDSE